MRNGGPTIRMKSRQGSRIHDDPVLWDPALAGCDGACVGLERRSPGVAGAAGLSDVARCFRRERLFTSVLTFPKPRRDSGNLLHAGGSAKPRIRELLDALALVGLGDEEIALRIHGEVVC